MLVAASLQSRAFRIVAAVSVVALLLHIWTIMGGNPRSEDPDFYRIDMDRSLSEHFEYAMLFGAGLAQLATGIRRRTVFYLFPAIVCFYLMLDNLLQLHEGFGVLLVPAHAGAGEVIFAGLAALAIVAVGRYMLQTTARFERRALIAFGLAIACFGLFAVGVDAIHSVVDQFWPRYERRLGMIEDFGEMLSICLLFAVSMQVFRLAIPAEAEAQFAE